MRSTKKLTGIYKITNLVNNKIYIGSAGTKDGFKKRWGNHKNDLNKNKHHSRHLQSAWNKYGSGNFKFEILEMVEDITKILEREQHYLDILKPWNDKIGYNICKNATSSLGVTRTDEVKKKLSEAHKGKPSSRKGIKASEEARKNQSEGQKGRKHTKESVKKRADKLRNIPRTDEVKKKISDKLKDQKRSKETLIKMSKASTGRIPTNRIKVVQLDLFGDEIKTWDSMSEAAAELNIQISKISSVCGGKRQTTGGFKWKYAN